MIQIIKEGTRKIADCHVCGCKFSYEAEDVISIVDSFHKDMKTASVICPQCNSDVPLVLVRRLPDDR